jgi:hypothetical protein
MQATITRVAKAENQTGRRPTTNATKRIARNAAPGAQRKAKDQNRSRGNCFLLTGNLTGVIAEKISPNDRGQPRRLGTVGCADLSASCLGKQDERQAAETVLQRSLELFTALRNPSKNSEFGSKRSDDANLKLDTPIFSWPRLHFD